MKPQEIQIEVLSPINITTHFSALNCQEMLHDDK